MKLPAKVLRSKILTGKFINSFYNLFILNYIAFN